RARPRHRRRVVRRHLPRGPPDRRGAAARAGRGRGVPLAAVVVSGAPDFSALGAAFGFSGGLLEAAAVGGGHIHDTYRLRFARGPAAGEALVQRINERVFGDPEPLMQNIARVTAHQHQKLRGAPDAERRALLLLPAEEGATWWRDPDGDAWRAYA